LLELSRETFSEVHIETRYADREFIDNEWLAYLRQAGISYCIRCKENAQIAGKDGTRQALDGPLSGAENRRRKIGAGDAV